MIKEQNFKKKFNNAPLFFGALFLIFGILCSVLLFSYDMSAIFFAPIIPTFAIGVIIFILLIVGAILFIIKKNSLILLSIIIVFIGFFIGQICLENGYEKNGLPKHHTITGKIVKIKENGENSISIILNDVNLINDNTITELRGNAALIVYGQNSSYLESEYYLPNSIISVDTSLMYAINAPEYGFKSERLDMLSDGVYYKALAHYAQIEVVHLARVPGLQKLFNDLRKDTFGRMQRYIGDGEAQLFQALITGNKSSLDNDITNNFSKLGISHLLATSGLHIGILLLMIEYLLKKLRAPIVIRSIVCAAIIIFFISFVGFRHSMVRASLMWALLVLSRIIGRKINPLNALGGAMFFMLMLNPFTIFSISFVLSCFSVTAIALLLENKKLFENVKKCKWAVNAAAASLAVVLFTWPITAYYFNTVSLLSPLYNILFVPFLGAALFVGIVFCVFSGVGFLAALFGTIAKAIAFIAIQGADFLAGFAPTLDMISPPIYVILLWCTGMFFLSRIVATTPKKNYIVLSSSLLALALVIMTISQGSTINREQMKIYSDGSTAFIYMQDNDENMLIINTDSYLVPSIIKKSGIRSLDKIIYFGNDDIKLKELINDLEDIKIDRIYAPMSVAVQANDNGLTVFCMSDVTFLNSEIKLLPFKAKSATSKINYAAYINKTDLEILMLDPLALRENAFEKNLYDSVIATKWSKSRAENILELDFNTLYYPLNDLELYKTLLPLEQKGVKTYNVLNEATTIYPRGD